MKPMDNLPVWDMATSTSTSVHIIVLLTSLYKRIVYAWGLLVALVTRYMTINSTLYVGNISLFSTPYTEKVFCFYYTVRAPCTFKAPVLRQTMATLFFFKNTPLGGAA